jgi:hypothetical protein
MKGLELLKPVPAHEDDPAFVDLVDAIIANAVDATLPAEVFVVKVKNWFGARWLGFSGKVLGALGVRKRDLTVPPFVPNRVLEQTAFRRVADAYQPFEPGKTLHLHQPSNENLQRRLSLISMEGAFFWFSSGSKKNGRGSLMGYLPSRDGYRLWYLELKRTRAWSVAQLVGIANQELETLMKPRHDSAVV